MPTSSLMDCVVDLDFHHSLAIISVLLFASPLAIWFCFWWILDLARVFEGLRKMVVL